MSVGVGLQLLLMKTTKKDFETANRKKFCARIATGDYDAVIIGHSQFEKIPLSPERQERQLREQIDEIEGAIAELKYQNGENFTIKQMEKTRKSLQTRLDKLLSTDRKDDVVTFEQGCVSMRFLKFVGKMVLKLVALPVLFVLGLICLLAKLVVNVSSFAIGALILYILGCCIYCVFQSLWLQLGLLVGIGLAVYAVLFLFVLFQEIGEHIKENLRDFIFS